MLVIIHHLKVQKEMEMPNISYAIYLTLSYLKRKIKEKVVNKNARSLKAEKRVPRLLC